MENIIIRNTQSPGDLIVLTAALRDLHRAHPGRFRFGVDVSQPAVFTNSPYVVAGMTQGKQIVAEYPAVHKSNQRQLHFLWGFIENLNKKLNANAVLTEFRPDLHLSPEERDTPPLGPGIKYWVMVSGGKMDFTAKWWTPDRWQTVVNGLRDRFEIVQVGGTGNTKHPHVHPALANTRNLIGKTSFRELARLIYHSEGVLCIVTCLMHIAAAFNKPCVTVAGGREPWWWEAYNHESRLFSMRHGQPNWQPPENDSFRAQQYLHTMNQLSCCMGRGCWRSHPIPPVGQKPPHSACPPESRIHLPDRVLPKCMDLITPEHVLQAVNSFYEAQPAQITIQAAEPPKPGVPRLEVQPARPPEAAGSKKQYTIAIQCPAGTRATDCAALADQLMNTANLTFLTLEQDPAIEAICCSRGLSYSSDATFGLQIKKAAIRSTTQFFLALPVSWQPTSQGLRTVLFKIRKHEQAVAGLVYKKHVSEDFQARFNQPLARNERQGRGFTILYPGSRLFAAHTEFVRNSEAEHLDDPVVFGEMIRQRGGQLLESGTDFLHP